MTRDEILDAAVAEIPGVLKGAGVTRPDVCVLGSRVGYDVLRYYGLDPKPTPVQVVVLNDLARDWVEARGYPESPEDMEEWHTSDAWIIAADLQAHGTKGYPGHLILTEGDDVIDLSTGQFNRPQRNIYLPDALRFNLDGKTLDEGEAFAIVDDDTDTVCYVGYVLLPKPEKDFRVAPDWKHRSELPGLAIRRIRDLIGAPA